MINIANRDPEKAGGRVGECSYNSVLSNKQMKICISLLINALVSAVMIDDKQKRTRISGDKAVSDKKFESDERTVGLKLLAGDELLQLQYTQRSEIRNQ